MGPPGLKPEVENELISMGHTINHKSLGCSIQAIMRGPSGVLHGVSDPRGEGMSFGI